MLFKNFIKKLNIFKLDASTNVTFTHEIATSKNSRLVIITLLILIVLVSAVLATILYVHSSKANKAVNDMISHIEYTLPIPSNWKMEISDLTIDISRPQNGQPLSILTKMTYN